MEKKTLGILGLVAVVVLVGLFASGKFNRGGDDQLAAGKGSGGTTPVVYCSDPDGGVNTSTKGTTYTYTLNKRGVQSVVSTQTDACSGSSNITEYSCVANAIASTTTSCGTGMACVDGACVVSTGGGTGDTVAPSVTMLGFTNELVAPGEGYKTSITVSPYAAPENDYWVISVNATDNIGISSVEFLFNGNAIATQDAPPVVSQSGSIYSMHIENELIALPNGTMTDVTARVCDTNTNCSISTGVTARTEYISSGGKTY